MSPAHERAAKRLAALEREERDWILARLSSADALRIRELMEPRGSAAEAQGLPQAPAARGAAAEAATEAASQATPDSVLERASAGDVSRALQDEPDWFIALVLARRRWPWDREVLGRFEPARLEALGEAARRAREAAKSRACQAAVEVLAARLRELAPAAAAPSAFDDLLAGMLTGGSPQAPGAHAWRA